MVSIKSRVHAQGAFYVVVQHVWWNEIWINRLESQRKGRYLCVLVCIVARRLNKLRVETTRGCCSETEIICLIMQCKIIYDSYVIETRWIGLNVWCLSLRALVLRGRRLTSGPGIVIVTCESSGQWMNDPASVQFLAKPFALLSHTNLRMSVGQYSWFFLGLRTWKWTLLQICQRSEIAGFGKKTALEPWAAMVKSTAWTHWNLRDLLFFGDVMFACSHSIYGPLFGG